MFQNSTPLNWHNSMKKLRRDAQLGHSEHSLNHLIVKRKPASLFVAHALRDITAVVDKKHKDVPGVREAMKNVGATSASEPAKVVEVRPPELASNRETYSEVEKHLNPPKPARAQAPPRFKSATHQATEQLFNPAQTGRQVRNTLPPADESDIAPAQRAPSRRRPRSKSPEPPKVEPPTPVEPPQPPRSKSRKGFVRGTVVPIVEGVGNVAGTVKRGFDTVHQYLVDGMDRLGKHAYDTALEAEKHLTESEKQKAEKDRQIAEQRATEEAKQKARAVSEEARQKARAVSENARKKAREATERAVAEDARQRAREATERALAEEVKPNEQKATPATPLTYNGFQKANAGKGLSSKAMGAAWAQYKAANNM